MPEEKKNESEKKDPTQKQVSLVNIVETQKTVRHTVTAVAVIAVVGIITWGVIRVFTHDLWLEVILCIFGPGGTMVLIIRFMISRLRRKLAAAEEEIKKFNAPSQGDVPKGDAT